MDRFLYTSVVVPTLPCAAVPTVSGLPEAGAHRNPQARACTRPGAVSERSPWGSLASVSGRLALGPDVRRGRRSLRVLSQQGCWGEVWVSEAGSLGVRGQGSSHARGGAGTDSDQARVRAAAMACAVSAEDNGLHTTTSVLSFFCFANTI